MFETFRKWTRNGLLKPIKNTVIGILSICLAVSPEPESATPAPAFTTVHASLPSSRMHRATPTTAPWLVVLTDFAFALMFAFLALVGVGEIDPQVFSQKVSLPTAVRTAGQPVGILVAPRLEDGRWIFVDRSGERLRATELVARAKGEGKGVVLVMGKDASVGSYLEAMETLVRMGEKIPVTLGVKRSEQ